LFDFVGSATKVYERVDGLFEVAQRRGAVRGDIPAMTLTRAFMGLVEVNLRGLVYCPHLFLDPDFAENTIRVLLEGIAGGARSGPRLERERAGGDGPDTPAA